MIRLFKGLEESPKSYEELKAKILSLFPPSVFRNYLLYALFVYKILKPLPTFDLDRSFDLPYLVKFVSGLPQELRVPVRETFLDFKPSFVHDWRSDVLNGFCYARYLTHQPDCMPEIEARIREVRITVEAQAAKAASPHHKPLPHQARAAKN